MGLAFINKEQISRLHINLKSKIYSKIGNQNKSEIGNQCLLYNIRIAKLKITGE
jgi:hypothetical protein